MRSKITDSSTRVYLIIDFDYVIGSEKYLCAAARAFATCFVIYVGYTESSILLGVRVVMLYCRTFKLMMYYEITTCYSGISWW